MTLWPLWSAALGAAAYAYHLRRRAACEHCGEGGGSGAGDDETRAGRCQDTVPQVDCPRGSVVNSPGP